ncbi:hypothetical protein FPH35_24780, partial [Escherichia coli]
SVSLLNTAASCGNGSASTSVRTETFKAEVERRAGIKFEPIRPYEFTPAGRHHQPDKRSASGS